VIAAVCGDISSWRESISMESSLSGATLSQRNPSRITAETIPLADLRKFASENHLYAILDACDTPAVPLKVNEMGEANAVSLYRGEAEEDYWAIAPYLVRVDPSFLDWIGNTLWEEHWGIFAVVEADLQTLRTHFRKFLTVQMPDGEKVYFRFYDPRVLPQFLRSCNDAELGEFFGSIQEYGCGLTDQKRVTLLRR